MWDSTEFTITYSLSLLAVNKKFTQQKGWERKKFFRIYAYSFHSFLIHICVFTHQIRQKNTRMSFYPDLFFFIEYFWPILIVMVLILILSDKKKHSNQLNEFRFDLLNDFEFRLIKFVFPFSFGIFSFWKVIWKSLGDCIDICLSFVVVVAIFISFFFFVVFSLVYSAIRFRF